MIRAYILSVFFVVFSLNTPASAQDRTVTYYQGLEMDIYLPESGGDFPVVLFVHGGGFSGGSRNSPEIIDFGDFLNRNGIAMVSISYRLNMKGRGFGCDIPAAEKLQTFADAALDASRATKYLIENVRETGIDPSRIILCGSSAGAETVLHLAYWKEASTFDGRPVLPSDFKYAGVISFAGALMDDQLITAANVIPTMMIHGTCDNLVPYGYAPHHYCGKSDTGYLMLHGAGSLATRIKNLDAPYYLITVCGGNHDWAGRPMNEMREEILDFINTDILEGQSRQIHSWISGEAGCSYDQPDECGK